MSTASNPASVRSAADVTRNGPFRPSQSLRRAFSIIGIGAVNFLLTIVVIATLLPPDRTSRWDLFRFEVHRSAVAAVAHAPMLLLVIWAVLARERWLVRAITTFVGLVFWSLALAFQFGVGPSVDPLALWFTVVLLVPLRSLFGLAIAWDGETMTTTRRTQFRLADILGWTAAIAGTLSFFRLMVGPDFFSDYGQRILRESTATFAASALVGVPCLLLALRRDHHLSGWLWLLGWILLCGAIFLGGFMAVAWVTGRYWWFHVIVASTQLLAFLLVLAVTLFTNIRALQWAGLRWHRTAIASSCSVFPNES